MQLYTMATFVVVYAFVRVCVCVRACMCVRVCDFIRKMLDPATCWLSNG